MDVHSMMAQGMKRAQPFRAAHLSICNPPAKASAEESHNKSAALPCTAAGSSFCGRKLQGSIHKLEGSCREVPVQR